MPFQEIARHFDACWDLVGAAILLGALLGGLLVHRLRPGR